MLSELRLRTRSDVLIGPRRLDASSVLRAVTTEHTAQACTRPRKGPAKGGSGGGSGSGRQDPGGSRAGLPQRGVEKGIRVNAPGAG
eukprot:1520686-Amphidinium_carterae.1